MNSRTTPRGTRRVAATLVALAALGPGAAPVTAASAATPSRPTTVQVCGGRTEQRPVTLIGSCYSGDLVWRRLHWTHWNSKHPVAVGVQQRSTTDSAKGPVTTTRVRLVLGLPRVVRGERRFQQVTVQQADTHRTIDEYRLTGAGAVFVD